jgi:dTDP-4-amino-4,6-dideoxygalactose transaminase
VWLALRSVVRRGIATPYPPLAHPPTSAPRFYPTGRQTIDEDDVAAVIAALGGEMLTGGPEVARFEAALAGVLGARYVTACSSGTAALHLAYLALGIGPGDEVITSPITFSATASAAYQVGATVRFADVHGRTGNLDPASVAALIGPRTRAITVVHLGGLPADLDSLAALASRHGLALIEDACHALGATYRGRMVASGAVDASVLSFHPMKHITTGEGGAVVLRDPAQHERVQRLRYHGIEHDPTQMSRPSPGPWYHEVAEQGFNYRMSNLACALGRSQLAKLPGFLAARRTTAAAYRAALTAQFGTGTDSPVQAPMTAPDRDSAYYSFSVAIDFEGLGVDRGEIMTALAGRGVGTQVHFIPLPHHPFHRAQAGEHADMLRPGADHYSQRTLSLPMYPGLDETDAKTIVGTLVSVLEAHR